MVLDNGSTCIPHAYHMQRFPQKRKQVLDQLVLPTCSNSLANMVEGGDSEQKNPLQGPVVVCHHLLGRYSHRLTYIFWVNLDLWCLPHHVLAKQKTHPHTTLRNMTMKTYDNHIRYTKTNNTLSKADQRSLHPSLALHDVAFLG